MRKTQYHHFPICLRQKGLTSQQKPSSLDTAQNFLLVRIVTDIEVPCLGSLQKPPSPVRKELDISVNGQILSCPSLFFMVEASISIAHWQQRFHVPGENHSRKKHKTNHRLNIRFLEKCCCSCSYYSI